MQQGTCDAVDNLPTYNLVHNLTSEQNNSIAAVVCDCGTNLPGVTDRGTPLHRVTDKGTTDDSDCVSKTHVLTSLLVLACLAIVVAVCLCWRQNKQIKTLKSAMSSSNHQDTERLISGNGLSLLCSLMAS